MLAPLAPHIAEELWSRLGHAESLTWADFPVADPALLVDETIDIPVQINGKMRAVVTMAAGLDADRRPRRLPGPMPGSPGCSRAKRSGA